MAVRAGRRRRLSRGDEAADRAKELLSPGVLDGAPDALRRRRHLDVLHTKLGQRIDDRVDHGAQGRCRAAFAPAAQTEGIGRGGYFADLGRKRWEEVSARQRVVHKRRRLHLAGRAVVATELQQCLPDARRDAPWVWPWRIIGLTARPTSSTVV